MPALKPTDFKAEIVWLGRVENNEGSIRSVPLNEMQLSLAGADGELHSGETRPSCVRVRSQHPEGTIIRNTRQLSVVSEEELGIIAEEVGLDEIHPEWLGASVVVRGIPDFTYVPPSSRLQTEEGTTLVVDMENRPCNFPAREIEKDRPGHGKKFKKAATGRRGVTMWVEREGKLSVGDTLTLHIPDQPMWSHIDSARQTGN
ncbi:Putative metal-sulfur cluster biosynthesis proteins YuaD [Roseovarius albus]|uniref:Putative metal-sulfur cluster biosynthesis proteins YuaD n=1 Tax=Roseovarius albus TaxID=1247867 RepID=A0A1X6YFL1_9RHOB|nr:MOSC domain-containing protein [Roseovarius albus]SLN20008.1 Putative metal-sulfur cluster biosynthesis proteins YuaD [Roseovarius albus]